MEEELFSFRPFSFQKRISIIPTVIKKTFENMLTILKGFSSFLVYTLDQMLPSRKSRACNFQI